MGLLLGLLKRPDEEQRGAVVAGLAWLARAVGGAGVECEVLPHVWGQVEHRRAERRLLVAEAVGCLAPHTPAALRDSLLLSVLLQLLQGERDAHVRDAVLTSLALLTAFLRDTDKLPLLADAALSCLAAPTPPTTTPTPAAHHAAPSPALLLLLGALGAWATEAGRLPIVLDALLALLEGQAGGGEQGGTDVACTVHALAALLPHVLAALLASVPPGTDTPRDDTDPTTPPLDTLPPCAAVAGLQELWGGPGSAGAALVQLHAVLAREWLPPWPLLQYVRGTLLPRLVGAVSGLQAWPGPALDAFLALFRQLPRCLGAALTTNTLTPLFLARLDGADPEAVRSGHTGLTGPVSVVYVGAVLADGGVGGAAGAPSEVEGFLARQVSIVAQCGAPLDAPLLSVALLVAAPRHTEAVVGALWGAVVHRAPAVRCAAAALWGAAVGAVPDAALRARVVPALVTLAADQHVAVKAATLTPLATALTATNQPEVVDKVWLQLESLADDSSLSEQKEFQLSLAHTCTHLAHTAHPALIQQFLLPRMCRVVMGGGASVGEDVGAALLEAYSALTCCLLPDHVIAHLVLPPLMQLQKWLGGASFGYMETLTDLVREYSLRTQTNTATAPERQQTTQRR